MKFLKLYNSVKVVSGFNRSLIFDTQLGNVAFIPNDLYQILEECGGFKTATIFREFGSENRLVIQEYIDFLFSKKFAFSCESKIEFDSFPRINETFDLPYEISYLIVDIENVNNFNKSIINEVIANNITYVQFRFRTRIIYSEFVLFLNYLKMLNDSFVNEISIVIEYDEDIYKFLRGNTFIVNKYIDVLFYSSATDGEKETLDNLSYKFVKKKLNLPFCCGVVNKANFVFNEIFLSESCSFNTCLNRKISIDVDGNIKNCPSMNEHFGNISNTSLREVILNKDFKKYWNVSKNSIEVCKDCEFRHVCTDCRAYTERTHFEGEMDLSKPLKCGYNPYSNVWSDWSTNPLKEKAIEYYGMQELVKKEN